MYGCRKNGIDRHNTTSTYIRKQAWVDTQSSPKSTYTAELETSDECGTAIIPISVNATGRQTSVSISS